MQGDTCFLTCLILQSTHQPNYIFLKNCFLLLLTLASVTLYAQERKPISGKVVSDFDDLEGIYVINKNADKSVLTSRGGYFNIPATVNDTLVFSSLQFEAKTVVVCEENTNADLLFVPLEVLHRELNELVIVDYSHIINTETLGLVPKGQKQYTPAEKKLATASKFKMNPLGLDPIINMFSGRTAMLRDAADIEKKEDLMEKINYIYTAEDIVAKLKIPADYVRGFVFYVVENKYFSNAMNARNENMAKFLLAGLATKYLALINENE